MLGQNCKPERASYTGQCLGNIANHKQQATFDNAANLQNLKKKLHHGGTSLPIYGGTSMHAHMHASKHTHSLSLVVLFLI